jgi:hypothetical protein
MHYVIHFVIMCTLHHMKEQGLLIIGVCMSQYLSLVGDDDIKYCQFGECINSCNENQSQSCKGHILQDFIHECQDMCQFTLECGN